MRKKGVWRKIVVAPPLVGIEPNPGPSGHGRLSREERWRVVHLALETHLSARSIARRMNISRDTVSSTLKRKISKHPPKLHVWAAAGYYFKARLYFFTQNMDAKLYQTIIKARLPENKLIYSRDCPRRYKGAWGYLQDNDTEHKATTTMQLLESEVG